WGFACAEWRQEGHRQTCARQENGNDKSLLVTSRTWVARWPRSERGHLCVSANLARASGDRRAATAALRDFSPSMSASLIGHSGSSAFRPSTTPVSMSLAGLSLLFGLGTKALPSWDSKTRWNNLLGDLAVNVTAGSSGHTNSPHPSSREGHHSTVWADFR